jgi:hypothetical protein
VESERYLVLELTLGDQFLAIPPPLKALEVGQRYYKANRSTKSIQPLLGKKSRRRSHPAVQLARGMFKRQPAAA